MIHDTWITLFYEAGPSLHAAKLATTYAPLVSCARAGKRVKIRADGRWEFGDRDVYPTDVRPCDAAFLLKHWGMR